MRLKRKDLGCITLNQHLDFAPFRGFPEVSGNIEEDGLEEQKEAHPLVVGVVRYFLSIIQVGQWSHTRMGRVFTLLNLPSIKKVKFKS